LSKVERLATSTIGAELGNIKDGQQVRWTVQKLSDIPLVSSSMLNAFAEIAMPFLHTYGKLENTFDILCLTTVL